MQKLILVAVLALACTANAKQMTKEEGNQLANTFLDAMRNTLASGSMQKMADQLFDKQIEYEWSGPQTGKGSAALVKDFAGTWGAMVANFLPGTPYTITDTKARRVSIAFDLTININGHGKVKDCFATQPIVFTLTFNDRRKVTKWLGQWDPNDAQMNACMGKIQKHMKAAEF